MKNRRDFIRNTALGGVGFSLLARDRGMILKTELPDNPLILFDNFHVGQGRSYSWKSKFAAAKHAGFDGFEFAGQDPTSDSWKEAMDLTATTGFKVWGFHMTTRAVIDRLADTIDDEIGRIIENVRVCGKSPLRPYCTLSLSGTEELGGTTVAERGSAKAQDRHWARAYKIISAFDAACSEYEVVGSLYPHINWICDTPQSAFKILQGAQAKSIGSAFCSHHWFGNKNSDDIDTVLANPWMDRLRYVVLTNGHFSDTGFRAARFNDGDIDMAWILAKLYAFGYKGPISSQGWNIGGDPYIACKAFVDGVHAIRRRFFEHPEMNPLA